MEQQDHQDGDAVEDVIPAVRPSNVSRRGGILAVLRTLWRKMPPSKNPDAKPLKK